MSVRIPIQTNLMDSSKSFSEAPFLSFKTFKNLYFSAFFKKTQQPVTPQFKKRIFKKNWAKKLNTASAKLFSKSPRKQQNNEQSRPYEVQMEDGKFIELQPYFTSDKETKPIALREVYPSDPVERTIASKENATVSRKESIPFLIKMLWLQICQQTLSLASEKHCDVSKKDIQNIADLVLKFFSKEKNIQDLRKKFPELSEEALQAKTQTILIKHILSFLNKNIAPSSLDKQIALLEGVNKIYIVGYKRVLGIGGFNTATLVEDIYKKKLRVFRELREKDKNIIEARYEAYIHSLLQVNSKTAKEIVKLNGVVDNEKSFGLVLEYCNGGTLNDKYVQFSPEIKKDIAIKLLHSLAHMHESGFAHADLKLENILLQKCGGEWVPKLADFGKSFLLKGKTVYRGGDFRYMAPEAFFPDTKKNEKIDCWAMGLILYTLKYYKIPSFTILFNELGILQNAHRFPNLESLGRHFEEMIRISNQRLKQSLDLEDEYDQLIAGLLQIEPKKRISCREAYEMAKDVSIQSFSIDIKELKNMGYFITDMSHKTVINQLKYNLTSTKWQFPQCAIVKNDSGENVFVHTKIHGKRKKVCANPCKLEKKEGYLYIRIIDREIPISKILQKYHHLVTS